MPEHEPWRPELPKRTDAIYVDFVEDEHGARRWTDPADRLAYLDQDYMRPFQSSRAVGLVRRLEQVGVLSVDGLQAVRSTWSGFEVTDDLTFPQLFEINRRTLQLLEEQSALEKDEAGGFIRDVQDAVSEVLDAWCFPLFTLNLSILKVDRKDLERERADRLAKEWEHFS